jgi:hypothetical protein
MTAQPVRLKRLLRQQHLQTYGTFRREYDKAARSVDAELEGTAPSRAQLYRWLSGELKGLPYPHHCRVLEKLFPGWTAAQLFEHCDPQADSTDPGPAQIAQLFDLIDTGLSEPGLAPPQWGTPHGPAHPPSASDADMGQDLLPAAVSTHADPETSTATKELGQRLLTLGKVRQLPTSEVEQLARLAGNIVELDLNIQLDIVGDGRATVSYRHELLNMSDRPLTKLARELWFEHLTGPLVITPTTDPQRHIAIQRVHDTATMAKFACQISPAIRPGETGVIGYTSEGGQFLDDHYWREALRRYTRHLTIQLRHRGGEQLTVCTAIEEHADGSENSATEELMWDYDGDDVVITLMRDYLNPNQAVTLRWAVSHEPA